MPTKRATRWDWLLLQLWGTNAANAAVPNRAYPRLEQPRLAWHAVNVVRSLISGQAWLRDTRLDVIAIAIIFDLPDEHDPADAGPWIEAGRRTGNTLSITARVPLPDTHEEDTYVEAALYVAHRVVTVLEWAMTHLRLPQLFIRDISEPVFDDA